MLTLFPKQYGIGETIPMALFNWEDHAVVTLALVSVTLYTIYGAIYRLFLSPLSKFPGPKIAALTSW